MNTKIQSLKIVCLLNMVSQSTIPLENFSKINDVSIVKHVISLYQAQSDLKTFLQNNYPESKQTSHGLSDSDSNNFLFKLLPKYLKLIRKLQPDFVHAHHTKAVVAGIVSRLFFRIPFFVTIHNDFNHFKPHQKFAWYMGCRISDVIICNSENTKSSLPHSVQKSQKIHTIYNGVDFDKVKRMAIGNEYTHAYTIGTVCRMVPQKDLVTLLMGFRSYLGDSEAPESSLVLIGDGPEKKNLVELSNELNIQDKVIFKGEMSREDVYRELGKLDVFVVSSIYEGFCNAMVEAAGAGVPVVATDIEPLPEVMGRDNARFFPVGDSQALGAILKELEADPKERERLGCAAQEHVVSCYSLEASATKHAELYKSFVQSRKEKRKNY